MLRFQNGNITDAFKACKRKLEQWNQILCQVAAPFEVLHHSLNETYAANNLNAVCEITSSSKSRACDASYTSLSLWVWIENLNMNSRVVARTCHGLSGFIGIVGLQIVHELHSGGVRCQLQYPLTAGLQLEGDVNGPVDGQAQAMNTDLPVATSFQELLTACQLCPEICLHVDIHVIPPLWELPRKALPKCILHWVHLHSHRSGLCMHLH